MIGEGANLGVTQRGRIEFAARGGRINTDFIDNSAGVNTSDQEVNIKIALAPAVRAGKLDADARNKLLAEHDRRRGGGLAAQQLPAVAGAQPRRAPQRCAICRTIALLMRALEARGLLDRALEALPSRRWSCRSARGPGAACTRPELAVLLSYAKIALQHDLLAEQGARRAAARALAHRLFPAAAARALSPATSTKHSLRREIIALGLTNAIVNRGGPAHGGAAGRRDAARQRRTSRYAFMAAREVFELPQLWQRIDALDGKVDGDAQLRALRGDAGARERTDAVVPAQRHGDQRPRRHHRPPQGRARCAEARASRTCCRRAARQHIAEREQRFVVSGVPADLAADVARLEVLGLAPAITEIAGAARHPILRVARASSSRSASTCASADLAAKAAAIGALDTYDRLAIAQALSQLAAAQAAFTRDAIAGDSGQPWSLAPWLERFGARLRRVETTLEAVLGRMPLTIVAAVWWRPDSSASLRRLRPLLQHQPGRADQSDPARSASSGSLPARRRARQPRS